MLNLRTGWALLLLAATAGGAQDSKAGPVKETFDNGKVKAQYSLDADGMKDGQYQEFFESGKRKIVASYVHGVLERSYEEFYENGKPRVKKKYAKGKPDGDLLRYDDKGALLHHVMFRKGEVLHFPDLATPLPAFPRPVEAIRKKLDEIDPPAGVKKWDLAERYEEAPSLASPQKAGKLKKEYLEFALRHVKAYRWLCDLPIDLTVHEPYNESCQHGAVIMALNKDLSHEPPQPPGVAPDFFKKGYEGCNKSNISMYPKGSLRDSIDGFMEDSDPSNIERVGHRVWILTPELGKVGFGEAGPENTYKAMWVLDSTGKQPPKAARPGPKLPEFTSYPSAGLFPIEYLDPSAAWCVMPRGGPFPTGTKGELKIEVWSLNEEYDLDRKLDLNHTSIGLRGAIVFRPVFRKGENLLGGRFLVTITGKGPERISYLVEFVRRAA
ncbi:MAG: hypothetical protein HY293_11645 [Planctomycetes bacterium]|nr:hypothetical protein [Planctomycetota bacterium]